MPCQFGSAHFPPAYVMRGEAEKNLAFAGASSRDALSRKQPTAELRDAMLFPAGFSSSSGKPLPR
jgi:hypothetical protein